MVLQRAHSHLDAEYLATLPPDGRKGTLRLDRAREYEDSLTGNVYRTVSVRGSIVVLAEY
jgi:hypothetical protein